MIVNTDPAYLLDAAGGALILALGVWVLTLRPRARATVALGLFSTTFGSAFVVQNLVDPRSPDAAPYVVLTSAFLLAASAAVFLLASSFPRAVKGPERVWSLGLAAAAVALSVAFVAVDATPLLPGGVAKAAPAGSERVVAFGFTLLPAALATAVVLLALRWTASKDATERRRYAVIAGAIVLWPGYTAGALAIDDGGGFFPVVMAILAFAGALVLRAAAKGPAKAAARNVALLCFAAPLVGMAAAALWGGSGGFGAARLAMVLLLAYGILRQSLLDIDVKVRWTISKSTVAAAFIAVFFVASEAAQQFFGETLGSTYVGIAAAGMLVFAMAPLQRVAERLAERAVPVSSSSAPARGDGDRRVVLYRRAVRFAIRDGRISPDEEVHLFEVAQELGLGAGDAIRLRRDVEREARTPDGPASGSGFDR